MSAVASIRVARPDDADVAGLLRRYGGDIAQRYGSIKPWLPATPAADYAPPRGIFLVAEVEGRLLACGGVRPYPEVPATAELTRMYVVPEERRRGLSRRLLTALEDGARDLGYRRLRLMTGLPQPEALALYTSAGYQPIELFGPYAGEPSTRCFERELC